MNILLGITGSVAATLNKKLVVALQELGEVQVIFTKWGEWFVSKADQESLRLGTGILYPVKIHKDEDEWPQYTRPKTNEELSPQNINYANINMDVPRVWQKTDPILHIDLRRWASVLVIAPLTANTLAKMATGMCDNLLTSVWRCWDHNRPVIVAPAMNTMMWKNWPTTEQILQLQKLGVMVVQTAKKELACGDVGYGAMGDIKDIVWKTKEALRWAFPLKNYPPCVGIPINHHPGAFGFHRRHNFHTGVDLYTESNAVVSAVEGGTIVHIEKFTGPSVGHPWWEETWGMMIEGSSGVVNYGEISQPTRLSVGDRVKKGQVIGNVKRVLFEERLRRDIPGHSCSMLHIELYKHGTRDFAGWEDPSKDPNLLDPTPHLISAIGAPYTTLTWDNPEGKEVG